jgi:ubiquinone/menaquinone biosynthesis C-methylase UbiE
MQSKLTSTANVNARPISLQGRIRNALDHYSKIVIKEWLVRFPHLKDILTRTEYDIISALDRDGEVLGMNYGYFMTPPLTLSPNWESNRFQVQMYQRVASATDWKGQTALEIGSGRGGGAAYLMEQFCPASLIGLDLSPRAVDFCQRRYAGKPGLSFEVGNAEDLPFPDQVFDIVINVESSLHYPRIERFFAEVLRVLKPRGYFLYADLREPHEVERWQAQIAGSGLIKLSESDISAQVLYAVELDRERKRQLIERYVPRLLRFPLEIIAGLDGQPQLGRRIYSVFALLKP